MWQTATRMRWSTLNTHHNPHTLSLTSDRSSPIPFGRRANAACLPQNPTEQYLNEDLVVSGWGNTAGSGEGQHYPTILQVILSK